ncbi:hypothetical protein NEUTE1DRAFT_84077 [Neurospora tetrasperma FGSC 2508]|uniref:GET complex, subunit GET2 n=1 Tax=Neurospora tetrasperma (strain FGSC 2508 / ATCC MYA-4615 / P0657) TaxID=510951 RepID=F8MQN1_NEUT8|nr:uncharacterized protein NEUTE1DRAFT_84077 [Neurospora tetrasperma FGSC 2508]EGO56661.1 hypothetical protein NEUTE1DRAFT_84077 [Neurospora tetrasperma FGSC 2508]EGZ70464.1 hypothetical protein NEUTE2DRAFT_91856 [Neurospora tetrasperma FGSC 2509]
MTEGLSPADEAEARALEQARIRKERREAKIRANAGNRLNKITGLGGGVERDPPPTQPASSSSSNDDKTSPVPTSSSAPRVHADPEEVDISTSEHFYQPNTTPRVPKLPQPTQGPSPFDPNDLSEESLRQMMLGRESPMVPGAAGGDPFASLLGAGPGGPGGPGAEDPMMQMMLNMLGGGGAPGSGAGGMPPFPGGGFPGMPGMGGMMPPGMGMGQQGVPPAMAVPDRYSSLWRLLHTAVALGLGLYIALWTSFSGSKVDRDSKNILTGNNHHHVGAGDQVAVGFDTDSARRFFYVFATAEALLLTTRFFLEKGLAKSPVGGAFGGGMLGMAVGFLPQPWKGYLEIAMRYGQIFSTVKADILVCIFVLGVCSWWRS